MKQQDLFGDPKPLARRNDPVESKQAAEYIVSRVGYLQGEVMALVRRHPGQTVNELSELFHQRDPRRIGRRLPELLRLGCVTKGTSRPCTITGRMAATWMPK